MSLRPDHAFASPSRLPKVVCVLVALAVGGVIYATSANFAGGRTVVLGRTWPATDFVSIETIDHRDWDRLLQRYVSESGEVGYSDWQRAPADVEALDAYLGSLSRANPDLPAGREARLAFWINAYNALTIRQILTDYAAPTIPGQTVPRSGVNLGSAFWLRVGGRRFSLAQIEHQVLRPLREPRIHFAIVCGARGCPRLLNRAYQSNNLEQQLRDNSRSFFADPQKLEFDSATGQLRLSPILKWYADDFGGSQSQMLEQIIPYLPDRVTGQLPDKRRLRTEYLDYDWSLNDQTPANSDAPVPPSAPPADADETPLEHK